MCLDRPPENLLRAKIRKALAQPPSRIISILTYFRWRPDIKPDNILIVHGELKLADPAEMLPGGTETFGWSFLPFLIIHEFLIRSLGALECHPGWTFLV